MNYLIGLLMQGIDVHLVVHYTRGPREARDEILLALASVIGSRYNLGIRTGPIGTLTTGRVGSENDVDGPVVIFDRHRTMTRSLEGRESIVMI